MNATGYTYASVAAPLERPLYLSPSDRAQIPVSQPFAKSSASAERGGHSTAAPHRRILVATQMAHSGFLQGLARFAREHRWQLITDMLHTGVLPQRWDGDGIVAFVPYRSDITAYVAGTDMPCVTVSMTDECAASPRIQPDYFKIGRMAAEHLINRNCRNFIWAPYVDDLPNRECLQGFLAYIKSHGCACASLPPAHQKDQAVWQDEWTAWRQAVAAKLSSTSKRTGLFAFNDYVSAEIAAIAHENGIKVPETLAIVGVGNEAIECESAPITLTSVDPDLEQMAYRAARLLSEILDGESPEADSIKIAPRQIVGRESTAISSRGNPRVERALEHISEHYSDPNLSVASVADALTISRRQLERDFRSENGCTVREYIERVRMREAVRLLIELPACGIAEIAERIGILAPGNFFRIFRKCYGITPSTYRQRQVNPTAR